MKKTSILQFRVTSNQKRVIENLAEMNGYNSLSDFVRSRALQSNFVELRLNEIKDLLGKKELTNHD